jgi:hypothetical protein
VEDESRRQGILDIHKVYLQLNTEFLMEAKKELSTRWDMVKHLLTSGAHK